jgi:hypothetical protein
MLGIFSLRTPFKIAKPVIGFYAVLVVYVGFVQGIRNKSLRQYPMQEGGFLSTILAKTGLHIPEIAFSNSNRPASPNNETVSTFYQPIKASYIAVVADLIKPFKAYHISPNLKIHLLGLDSHMMMVVIDEKNFSVIVASVLRLPGSINFAAIVKGMTILSPSSSEKSTLR